MRLKELFDKTLDAITDRFQPETWEVPFDFMMLATLTALALAVTMIGFTIMHGV